MAVLSLSFGPYTQAGGPQTIALTTTQRSKKPSCDKGPARGPFLYRPTSS